ncbi:MAG: MarR family transcriptional regulator [Gemmatimonadaceae bacterium]|nr:MarR family transcriptional regulator [Gemmatimonadaceae bacterium]
MRHEIRQDRAFDSLQQEAFLNLVRSAAILEDALDRVLRTYGLSSVQYNVLRILRGAGADGLCRNEIRDRLVSRMPDVTRLLDRMQAAGLVTRVRSATDRRQVSTYITDAGSKVLRNATGPVEAEHARQLAALTPDQLRSLIDLTTLARKAAVT